MNHVVSFFCSLIFLSGSLAAVESQSVYLDVDGVRRAVLFYPPASSEKGPVPVVFGFHGHGGNAQQAARSFRLHEEWPEALVIYMQGLPTPGLITDPEGKRNGWQHDPGAQGDRDIRFFDTVLAAAKQKFSVDDKRVYLTGHSNGASFCGVLWLARPDVITAVAPSAGGGKSILRCQPKPVFYLAGENDPLVKIAGQRLVIQAARRLNGCEQEGTPWKNAIQYPSATGTPVVAWIHDGTHKYRPEAPAMIVAFFKEHPASPAVQKESPDSEDAGLAPVRTE